MKPENPESRSPHSRPLPADSYLTLAGQSESEIKIQRSRFIGLAAPAVDETAARQFITQVAKRFHDSRHVCFAWRVGPPHDATENDNDDGEPSGTAGKPILLQLRKCNLEQTVVVVVRYFGGVKLGTGGLARAYGQGAQLALAAANVREILQGQNYRVTFAYTQQKTVRHLLNQHDGKITEEEYGANVNWSVWLPHSQCQEFGRSLTEATAGALQLEVITED